MSPVGCAGCGAMVPGALIRCQNCGTPTRVSRAARPDQVTQGNVMRGCVVLGGVLLATAFTAQWLLR